MKARLVLWPVVIVGAFGLAGACSDGGSTSDSGNLGGEAAGGGDGKGASSSMGASSNTGGMPTGEGGSMTGSVGGDAAGGSDGVGGAGVDLCEGLELECEDDDNPCTEDECNPATGECGIPRSNTPCDDGLYCNGEDMCVEGECVAGEDDPCDGRTCNEGKDACECTMDEHCPADVPGEWGQCEYADEVCSEIGERSRIVTTFTCTGGLCVQGAESEKEACGARETDGIDCPSDGLRCNGTEACKSGVCSPTNTNQCPNMPGTPHCSETGALCNECTTNTHCAGGEKCCNRECIPSANICTKLPPTTITNPTTIVTPTTIINPVTG